MIFNLVNPVTQTVKDKEQLKYSHLTKYRLIPQYGTSLAVSKYFVDTYIALAELSPTFQAVQSDLTFFTFGMGTLLVDNTKEDTNTARTVSKALQSQYLQYWASLGVDLDAYDLLFTKLEAYLNINGGAFLRIRRILTGGAVKYSFSVPYISHALYVESADPGEKFVAISKWLYEEQELNKFPPAILRVTQENEPLRWMTTARGVEEAIIHVKRSGDFGESDFYPRSPLIAVLNWLYVDFQLGNMSAKVMATELITKILFLFEALPAEGFNPSDPEDALVELNDAGYIGTTKKDYFKAAMTTLKQIGTNMGAFQGSEKTGEKSAHTMAGFEYPNGVKEPKDVPLEINRDTKFFEWNLDTSVREIAARQGWVPELTGLRPTKTQLGGNLWYDMFITKGLTTIGPKQTKYEKLGNKILTQILDLENGPNEYRSLSREYINVVDVLMNKVKPAQPASETINNLNAAEDDPDSTE